MERGFMVNFSVHLMDVDGTNRVEIVIPAMNEDEAVHKAAKIHRDKVIYAVEYFG